MPVNFGHIFINIFYYLISLILFELIGGLCGYINNDQYFISTSSYFVVGFLMMLHTRNDDMIFKMITFIWWLTAFIMSQLSFNNISLFSNGLKYLTMTGYQIYHSDFSTYDLIQTLLAAIIIPLFTLSHLHILDKYNNINMRIANTIIFIISYFTILYFPNDIELNQYEFYRFVLGSFGIYSIFSNNYISYQEKQIIKKQNIDAIYNIAMTSDMPITNLMSFLNTLNDSHHVYSDDSINKVVNQIVIATNIIDQESIDILTDCFKFINEYIKTRPNTKFSIDDINTFIKDSNAKLQKYDQTKVDDVFNKILSYYSRSLYQ